MTYHITTKEELQAMSSDLNGYYILDNDIDLAGFTWVPVGGRVTGFRGTFNGGNHVISTFSYNLATGSSGGFFSYVYAATIQNVTFLNPVLTGGIIYQLGVLIGTASGGAVNLINCNVTGGSITCIGGGVGSSSIAGLIGNMQDGNISNCTITNLNITATYDSGCLVGYVTPNKGNISISDCHIVGGSVTGVPDDDGDIGELAGLVGICMGHVHSTSWITTIDGCSSSCEIINAGFECGGLVGYSRWCSISDSYATGDLTSRVGFDGWFSGGFVGAADDGTIISNCYATGDVTGTWDIGGFVGWQDDTVGGMISKCYSEGDVFGIIDNSTGIYAIGGFAGWCSIVRNCYSTGDVFSESSSVDTSFGIGGFVGSDGNYHTPYISVVNCYSSGNIVVTGNDAMAVGGFVGSHDNGYIINSYSVGSVTINGTGYTEIGGFAGELASDYVVNCSWSTDSSTYAIGYSDTFGTYIATLTEKVYGTDEVDKTKFYNVILKLPSHAVYDQGNANAWDFSTPVWYEWSTKYPLFISEGVVPPVVVSFKGYAFMIK